MLIADCLLPIAAVLADFPHYLHRAPVIIELLAAIETNDVVTALPNRLPVGVASA